jgi:hypothetical protein
VARTDNSTSYYKVRLYTRVEVASSDKNTTSHYIARLYTGLQVASSD